MAQVRDVRFLSVDACGNVFGLFAANTAAIRGMFKALNTEVLQMNSSKWLGIIAGGLLALLVVVFLAVKVGTTEAPLDAYVKGKGFEQCATLAGQMQGIAARWVVVAVVFGIVAFSASALGGYLSKESFFRVEWLKPLPVILSLLGCVLAWYGTDIVAKAEKASHAAATCTNALALANDKSRSDADAYEQCVLAKTEWLSSRAMQLLPSSGSANSTVAPSVSSNSK